MLQHLQCYVPIFLPKEDDDHVFNETRYVTYDLLRRTETPRPRPKRLGTLWCHDGRRSDSRAYALLTLSNHRNRLHRGKLLSYTYGVRNGRMRLGPGIWVLHLFTAYHYYDISSDSNDLLPYIYQSAHGALWSFLVMEYHLCTTKLSLLACSPVTYSMLGPHA